MSYFDKKFSVWVVAFLVVLNIGSLSALWLSNKTPQHPKPPGKDRISHFLQKELNLDEQQTKALEDLRREFHESTKPNMRERNESKRKMFDALTSPAMDSTTARQFAKSIADQQEQLELAVISHYIDIYNICNEEQQTKLGKVFHKAMKRGKPKGPPPERK